VLPQPDPRQGVAKRRSKPPTGSRRDRVSAPPPSTSRRDPASFVRSHAADLGLALLAVAVVVLIVAALSR
jgi:hypothetical protein